MLNRTRHSLTLRWVRRLGCTAQQPTHPEATYKAYTNLSYPHNPRGSYCTMQRGRATTDHQLSELGARKLGDSRSRKPHNPSQATQTQTMNHNPTQLPSPCPRAAWSRPPHSDPGHRAPRRNHLNYKQPAKGHNHPLLTLLHCTLPRGGKIRPIG